MSFLFGKKPKTLERNNSLDQPTNQVDLKTFTLGNYQPENPFRELVLLPYFTNTVAHICILDDEKRIVTGDDDGNLFVWDYLNGIKLVELKYHQQSINGIVKFSNIHENVDGPHQNVVVVSSNDKHLSVWDVDNYELIRTAKVSSTAYRLFSNCSFTSNGESYFFVAGLDIKLFVSDLTLVDEYVRKTKDNSIRFMILIKNDKLVLATNGDIEIYALVFLNNNSISADSTTPAKCAIKIKEIKKYPNTHEDSILCLNSIGESMFASGSSNGLFILWQTDNLNKLRELRPFEELVDQINHNRLSINSISCFQFLYEKFILICCGNNIAIYDTLKGNFVFKLLNAHNESKITDIIILSDNLVVTSSENGSIRIWKFEETNFTSNKNEPNSMIEVKLNLIGECLGHSSSIKYIKCLNGTDIISTSLDFSVIIWKNSFVADSNRNYELNRLMCDIKI